MQHTALVLILLLGGVTAWPFAGARQGLQAAVTQDTKVQTAATKVKSAAGKVTGKVKGALLGSPPPGGQPGGQPGVSLADKILGELLLIRLRLSDVSSQLEGVSKTVNKTAGVKQTDDDGQDGFKQEPNNSFRLNMFIPGGQVVPPTLRVFTLDKCLFYCSVSPLCAGVDWDTNTLRCWEHTTKTACREAESKLGSHHYKFRDCPRPQEPTERIVLFEDSLVGDGVLVNTHRTLEACVNLCAGAVNCISVDFDNNKTECYLHLTDTGCKKRRYDNCCTHARLPGQCKSDRMKLPPRPDKLPASPPDPLPGGSA